MRLHRGSYDSVSPPCPGGTPRSMVVPCRWSTGLRGPCSRRGSPPVTTSSSCSIGPGSSAPVWRWRRWCCWASSERVRSLWPVAGERDKPPSARARSQPQEPRGGFSDVDEGQAPPEQNQEDAQQGQELPGPAEARQDQHAARLDRARLPCDVRGGRGGRRG